MCLTTDEIDVSKIVNKNNKKHAKIDAKIDDLHSQISALEEEMENLYEVDAEEVVEYLKNKVVKTATKDITCWKRFLVKEGGKLETPYQHKAWPKNKLMKVKELGIYLTGDSDQTENQLDVNEGLHAYTDKAYKDGDITVHHPEELLFEMVIPKGAKYIVGEGEYEIVATAMKIKPIKKMAKTPGKTAKKTAKKAAKKKK
jgi:hypothetical protein